MLKNDFNLINQKYCVKLFNTTTLLFQQGQNENDKKQSSSNQNDDKKKEEDEEKFKQSIRASVLLTTFLMVISLGALLVSDQDSGIKMTEIISWNEFYNHILAKGEVQRLVINRGAEMVMVYVYPDALINGKRVSKS